MKKPEKLTIGLVSNNPVATARLRGYNDAIDDYEAWLKEVIPKEKKVPECLNDASVGEYELGFNDAIIEIKKKIKGE